MGLALITWMLKGPNIIGPVKNPAGYALAVTHAEGALEVLRLWNDHEAAQDREEALQEEYNRRECSRESYERIPFDFDALKPELQAALDNLNNYYGANTEGYADMLEQFADALPSRSGEGETDAELAKRLVDEFIELWNTCSAADIDWREWDDRPGEKVVVAGDNTWGDLPDGPGYTGLRLALALDLEVPFGIK